MISLEYMLGQMESLVQRKNAAIEMFHQLCGAISVLDEAIRAHQQKPEEPKPEETKEEEAP